MAVIARISQSASAHASIAYAIGKGENKFKNKELKASLEEHGVEIIQRAVAMGGTNGVLGDIAEEQFKAVRQQYGQDQAKNQVQRIIQSFSFDDFKYYDFEKANELGVQLAQEMYPEYQSAVYTHVDGENGVIHNHIIVNKVNLHTGKKLDERRGEAVKRAREINDKISLQQGFKVIEKPRETVSKAEEYFGSDSWRSLVKFRINRLSTSFEHLGVKDWETFKQEMKKNKVDIVERGKTLTYVLTDKDGKEHRVRANKLGTNFEKDFIEKTIAETVESVKINDDTQRIERDIEQREPEATRTTSRIGNQIQRIRDGITQAQSAIRRLIERLRQSAQATERRAEPKKEQRPEPAQADPRPEVQAGGAKLFALLDEQQNPAVIFNALDKATMAKITYDSSGDMAKRIEVVENTITIDITKPASPELVNNIGEEISKITGYSVEDIATLANRGHQFSPLDSVKNPVKQSPERSFTQSRNQSQQRGPRM